jgi:hypothetical protein
LIFLKRPAAAMTFVMWVYGIENLIEMIAMERNRQA